MGAVVVLWLLPLPCYPPAVEQVPGPSEPDQLSPIVRGQYLVTLANCVSCHTAKAGTPFAGGRVFQTTYSFFGQLFSSNITPDRETGIGSWTEADFVRAMRTGIAPGNKHLFPAFPYTSFTKLATADIKSIYAYLRSIPPVHAVPPENSFWFRQRWVMGLWNALFFREGDIIFDSSQPSRWNRGRYLVAALGHCGACHTPRNSALAERTAAEFTGGTQMDEVAAGKTRAWSAPNLTSSDSGLAKWSAEELQKYLKTGFSRRAGVLGPMNEVIGNSMRYLSDSDVIAMATYIKSIPAAGDASQQTLNSEELAAGQALYDKHCEECHLSTGRGGFRKAPPVANSPIVQSQNAQSLINVILYGARPDANIPGAIDAWEDMPSFKDKMTDDEIAQLANFLRASFGNRGGHVSTRAVAAQR